MTNERSDDPMHVGIGLDHFDVAKGGLERAVAEFVRFLSDRGHEITLFTMDEPDEVCGMPPHVTIVRIPVAGMRASRERSFARGFGAEAHAAGCDVTLGMRHCPGVDVYWPHGGTVEASLRARDRGASRFVKAVRRLLSACSAKHRWFREAERRLIADDRVHVVAVSRLAAEALVGVGFASERVIVAENGVDLDRFRPPLPDESVAPTRARFGANADDVVVFFASHDFRLKGLRPLLDAFALASRTEPNLRLAVAGRDETKPYRKRARRLGIGERIQWLGAIDAPEVWLRAADVFVQPTAHDPCSLVTLEALASGCPVITTRANGAVDDGSSNPGAAVPAIVLDDPDDTGSLAVAIAAFSERAVRRACSAAARASVEGRTHERCHATVERVLAEAAAARREEGAS